MVCLFKSQSFGSRAACFTRSSRQLPAVTSHHLPSPPITSQQIFALRLKPTMCYERQSLASTRRGQRATESKQILQRRRRRQLQRLPTTHALQERGGRGAENCARSKTSASKGWGVQVEHTVHSLRTRSTLQRTAANQLRCQMQARERAARLLEAGSSGRPLAEQAGKTAAGPPLALVMGMRVCSKEAAQQDRGGHMRLQQRRCPSARTQRTRGGRRGCSGWSRAGEFWNCEGGEQQVQHSTATPAARCNWARGGMRFHRGAGVHAQMLQ